MQEERRKLNRRVSPAISEFALQERAEMLAIVYGILWVAQ